MRLILLGAVFFLGCGRVCTSPEKLTGLDGGVSVCVQNTDCPRPSSVLVCGQDEDQLRDCIACTKNECVRYHPVTCP